MGNIEAKTINYSKRFNTKFNGVFYRESITNDKLDKTYYIRYKDKDNKDKIMHKLYGALKPGGYLLMGAGESMIGTTVDFTQESLSSMMVFKKGNGTLKVAA